VLVNNFVLVKFLGLCPFMGVSKKLETAAGMGLATTFVLTLSSVTSWLVNEYLLVPLGIEYLRIIAFIVVIAAVVQFTETIMRKTSPLLYQVLGIFLPLITTNCAVLGVALLNLQAERTLPRGDALRVRRRGRLLAGAGAVRRGARAGRGRRMSRSPSRAAPSR
jgi:Na+-translocating ferredoxin:NAD+ oxidoreductase subunit A